MPTRLLIALLAAALIAAALGAWLFARSTAETARARVLDQAQATLALQAKALEGVLAKYRHMPAQLAHRGDVRALFREPSVAGAGTPEAMAQTIAGVSGAADVGFLSLEGGLAASANDVLASDAVDLGELTEAPRQGRLGRTLVRVGREPFYVFSYPVRSADERIVGVVAVAASLDRLSETWSLSLDPILVTTKEGELIDGNDLARAVLAGRAEAPIEAARFLPQTEWRLIVLKSDRSVREAFTDAMIRAILVILVSAMVLAALVWRSRAQRSALRREQAQALRLERRVRDRTGELERANRALRDAQGDLVQAAKLAALGRMSASLAHEYNQPLAAVRAHADNAAKLLERGRPDEVRTALDRIHAMAERMATLSKTLRSFARTPGHEVRPVSLARCMDETRLLAEPDAERRGIAIQWPDVADDLLVEGGTVRLSQILVNLVSNAVEAARSEVAVTVDTTDDVVIRVKDDGEGVDPAVASQIFDPFFTTRPVGQGLGLGLSIAFNIARDFGGSLRLAESEGGAVFELRLRRTEASPIEASRKLETV